MQYLLSRTTSLVVLSIMTLTYTMDQNTQSWIDPRLQICSSSSQSNRLFTTAPIAKDTLIAVFGGKIMSKETVLHLPAKQIKNVLQIDDALWIGSSQVEPTDFINHSCNPNTGLKGQIFLVAMRDIACGEEITFDYATVVSEWVGMEPLTCNCQTPSCRKKINSDDWQNKELQKKYLGYFAFYIQKKIDALNNNQSI